MVIEHQINTKEDCSAVWTSKFGFTLCTSASLQLRSNISERLLVPYHWLITLIFAWVNWRNLLPIHCLHVFHVLSLVKLFSLLRYGYCRFWFFLLCLFLSSLELFVCSKQVYLPPFALLRYGLWTLLQKVNCFTLAFCTYKFTVFNEWTILYE